jgi:hypothetical protein
MSYEGEKDMEVKIYKFLKVTGLINRILKPLKDQKHTRIKISNALTLLTLSYSSENWTTNAQDKTRI